LFYQLLHATRLPPPLPPEAEDATTGAISPSTVNVEHDKKRSTHDDIDPIAAI
jgi:hypothetical protein